MAFRYFVPAPKRAVAHGRQLFARRGYQENSGKNQSKGIPFKALIFAQIENLWRAIATSITNPPAQNKRTENDLEFQHVSPYIFGRVCSVLSLVNGTRGHS